ncbi:MAG: DUF58 domain-containing protein, partial [Planctomycetota bacterium]
MNEALSQAAQSNFQWLVALPWLLLSALMLPLILAARYGRIYPTWTWVIAMSVAVVVSLFAAIFPALVTLVFIVDGVIVAATACDFLLLYLTTNRGITASRDLPRTCSLGVPVGSTVTLENRTGVTLVGWIKDDLPDDFQTSPKSHELRLPPMGRMTALRQLTPRRRGAFKLEHVYLRLASRLRFWSRYLTLDIESDLNVYPDMKQLSDYALLARTDRLSLIGVRRTRRVGQDSDFERLRDYTRDDNYRHMDWRSTARRRKLTVRQFQSDQSQRVVFLLDCGRMMTNERDGYSLLDHSLNAALMMA